MFVGCGSELSPLGIPSRDSGSLTQESSVSPPGQDMLSSPGSQDTHVLQAKELLAQTLSPLVSVSPARRREPSPCLPRTTVASTQGPDTDTGAWQEEDPPLTDQPYRTLPLVLPRAKTIHDTVPANKFLTVSLASPGDQPYRNSAVGLATPRTINDLSVGEGAPVYQQYRGPQYNTPLAKPRVKSPGLVYNSPAPLYSEENLAEAALHPIYGQEAKAGLSGGASQWSDTHQVQPSPQHSDRASQLNRPTIDPVMKNNSINQSSSFKKVMYSVLGETEF